MRAERVSNKLSMTEIRLSTSVVGHTSQIARASDSYCVVSGIIFETSILLTSGPFTNYMTM